MISSQTTFRSQRAPRFSDFPVPASAQVTKDDFPVPASAQACFFCSSMRRVISQRTISKFSWLLKNCSLLMYVYTKISIFPGPASAHPGHQRRLSGPKTTFRPRRAPWSPKMTFRSQRAPRRASFALACVGHAQVTKDDFPVPATPQDASGRSATNATAGRYHISVRFRNFLGCSKTAACLCMFIQTLAFLSAKSWRFLLARWGALSSMYSIATDASGCFRTLQDALGSSLELLKAPVSLCRLSGPKTTFRPRRAPRSQKTTFRSQRAPRRARNFLGYSKTAACLCMFIQTLAFLRQMSWRFLLARWGQM